MMLKKYMASFLSAVMLLGVVPVFAAEVEKPSCVMLKFDDATRFAKVDTAGTLSELIMEKLVNSGKFNFKETKPMETDMAQALYENRLAEFKANKTSVDSGDYNGIFESEEFGENRVQTIDSAMVGKIVNPKVTTAMGEATGAEYLLQGTIINIGTGEYLNGNLVYLAFIPNVYNMFVGKNKGLAVIADVRIIKAETGEVIWQDTVVGRADQYQYDVGLFKIGSLKLNNETYFKAVNSAAEKVASAVIGAADKGVLFAK